MIALVVAALLALAPTSAQALTFSSLTAAPSNLEAGAHSDFSIHIGFGGAGDNVKNLTIGLPPGEVGDPNATPFCSVAQLNADSCPANTRVGSVSSSVTLLGLLASPLPVTGNLYNVQPQPGEPARFGIVLHALPINLPVVGSVLLPPIVLQSGVQLRQTDFGLNTVVKDIPNSATLLALGGATIPASISITAMDLSLFGIAPGTGRPFLRNPTSCTPHHAAFSATSYSGATATTPVTGQSPAFTPTGCGLLPFSPTFSAALDVPVRQPAGEKPTLTTSIDQAVGEAGLRDAEVFIPPDMGADLSRLTPDQVCEPADFAAGSCPQVAVLGSAMASSPLLTAPLSGPVYVLDNPGGVAKIGLDLHGQLNMRIQGQLGIDNTTTFSNLPDIPISHFQLTFNGGPNGILLTSRDICDPPAPVFHVEFAGYNGANTAVDQAATVTCGRGAVLAKCKKGKKKRRHRAAAEAKKHKKRSCAKKKRKKRR